MCQQVRVRDTSLFSYSLGPLLSHSPAGTPALEHPCHLGTSGARPAAAGSARGQRGPGPRGHLRPESSKHVAHFPQPSRAKTSFWGLLEALVSPLWKWRGCTPASSSVCVSFILTYTVSTYHLTTREQFFTGSWVSLSTFIPGKSWCLLLSTVFKGPQVDYGNGACLWNAGFF